MIQIDEKLNEPALTNDTQILYFEQSSVTLKEESKQKMNDILSTLKENPQLKIELIGHSDNVGNNHQNQYLSEIRAKYVSIFLASNGIDDYRMSVKGVGHTKPKAENTSEENRSLNRRVEIRLY
jgi:OmpA-OmpF porin, OOP family